MRRSRNKDNEIVRCVKATEKYFSVICVMLFIMLYKVVLVLKSVDEISPMV